MQLRNSQMKGTQGQGVWQVGWKFHVLHSKQPSQHLHMLTNLEDSQPPSFFFFLMEASLYMTHLKRPWCWERLKVGGEGGDRGWDGWMASLIWWTWVWVSSGSWWWTGKPGVLQSMGSQRAGHDWVPELTGISGLHIGINPCVQKFVFPSKRLCSCCSNAVRIIPGLIGWARVLLTKPPAPPPYAWEADHSHCVSAGCKEFLQSVKQCLCPPATTKAKSSLYNEQRAFSF